MLDVRGVSKAFGSVTALRGVTARFKRGCVHAVVGPNGCGKTTLLNIVSGFYTPDSGEVFWSSGRTVRLSSLSASARARFGVARAFQEPRSFPEFNTEDALLIGLLDSGSDNLLGTGLRRIPREGARAQAQGLLKMAGLSQAGGVLVDELSYGQRKLLDLLILFPSKPRVLLLDEPFAGLDPQNLGSMKDLISLQASEGRAAVVVVSHEHAVVRELADTLTLMEGGRVITTDSPEDVMRSRAFQAVYLG